jgi:hypothetical protein
MAQARNRGAQQHLVRRRLPEPDLLDDKRRIRFVQHGCLHRLASLGMVARLRRRLSRRTGPAKQLGL